MTQTLAIQPRRTAPDTIRCVSHPCYSRLLYFFCSSSTHSKSYSPAKHLPSSSFRSLCIVFLLAVSFLQTPHLTAAEAVTKAKGKTEEEIVAPSSTKAAVTSICGGDGRRDNSLTQQALVEDLKSKMSKHHGFELSAGLPSNMANLLNGTHPEGRKVRQRLRKLVKSRSLMSQGESSLENLLLSTHGSEKETYIFQSSERDLKLPIEAAKYDISETKPLSVLTFNTWFRLPQEVYHDLIMTSAILHLRTSRSEASWCRKLTSLGMRLTASIYLLKKKRHSSSLETNQDDCNSTFQEQPTLLKTTAFELDTDNLVTIVINQNLIEGIVDSDNGVIVLGVKVHAKQPERKTEKESSKINSVRRERIIVTINRELTKPATMYISSQSSSLSLLKKLSLSPPRSSIVSASSLSPSPDSIRQLTFSASILVSEASLQVNVITADLRHTIEPKSRTRRSRYYRSNFRNRNRSCREGFCCPKSADVNISGAFVWNNERHFILLGPYRVNYCTGRCRAGYNTNSNLGQFLSQLHRRHPKEVPGPTCIPDELGPLEVYVLDSDGYPEPREFPDMMIKSCKCL